MRWYHATGMQTQAHIHKHTNTSTCAQAHKHKHMCTSTQTQAYVHKHTNTSTYAHIIIVTYAQAHMQACMLQEFWLSQLQKLFQGTFLLKCLAVRWRATCRHCHLRHQVCQQVLTRRRGPYNKCLRSTKSIKQLYPDVWQTSSNKCWRQRVLQNSLINLRREQGQ